MDIKQYSQKDIRKLYHKLGPKDESQEYDFEKKGNSNTQEREDWILSDSKSN